MKFPLNPSLSHRMHQIALVAKKSKNSQNFSNYENPGLIYLILITDHIFMSNIEKLNLLPVLFHFFTCKDSLKSFMPDFATKTEWAALLNLSFFSIIIIKR